ncbi:integral peroxisomal membrane peroxin [Sporothrix schenckii 1099-18]|uniref:Integral peroxisomal membrane peroxin n=1 Tax=Sporothrix schenckii 1099-18 TaxID=1397361 RepID=A0A0F2LSQ1_SPOSC|nr:integral peroxisomal membrane peroxin [Sporothrix schenckii 1099-18]KJR80497.1 integral peroxisomal membrane peroxin [Sporothrix schenckii 1099-18]
MDEIAYLFLTGHEDDPPEEETPVPAAVPASPSPAVSNFNKSGHMTHSKLEAVGEVADDQSQTASPPVSPTPATHRKRRGFRDFLSKANSNIQDQLLDKYVEVIPIDNSHTNNDDADLGYSDPSFGAPPNVSDGAADTGGHGGVGSLDPNDDKPVKKQRPGFSVAIMSTNFRRFNARIGVVFRFQKKVERLLAWRRASHTLSFLGVYTFVCLDPYLLTLVPPAILLLGVLIPGFITRHPGTSTTNTPSLALPSEYYARGPPLAPPHTVKPVKELSRDFFHNMGDLQNSMEDFSVAHDKIVQTVVPATNFADEAFSSALFVALCVTAILLSLAAHLLPWRMMFLVGGWVVVCSGHPTAARLLRVWKTSMGTSPPPASAPRGDKASTDGKKDSATGGAVPKTEPASAASLWNAWVAADIILDEAPETREVEIFELQRRSTDAAEWEPWVFGPSPYDPLSQPRLNANAQASSPAAAFLGGSGGRPQGARFFEDVLPPQGWEWSEKKWALDLWSRDWVEERIITGVEVETEGERWVYDMYNEHEQQQQQQHQLAAAAESTGGSGYGDSDFYADSTGLHPPTATFRPQRRPLGPSWEEGEEGMGRRGEWRRRRWVRMVKRKKITVTA